MTRVVVIADGHAGHRSGLTPPDAQYPKHSNDSVIRKFAEIQAHLWSWYTDTLAVLQPIDCLVYNGDAIEGKGERSGATELITADREAQIGMAAKAIELARAKSVYIIAGTPYHVGRDEDWESILAERVGANHYGIHDWIDADGVIFDFKHRVASSAIPHGRYTAPERAALWNAIWAERGMQPRADVLIRSHVHYYTYSSDGQRLVMTTPALQAWTKYGSRDCEGTTDIGLVSFDCEGGDYTWIAHRLDMRWAAAKPFKVSNSGKSGKSSSTASQGRR